MIFKKIYDIIYIESEGKIKMNCWEVTAHLVEEAYGSYVDFKDRFFICPECEESIYESDWTDEELKVCPICGFDW